MKRRTAILSGPACDRVCWLMASVLLLQPAISELQGQDIAYSGSLEFASGHYQFAERTLSLFLYNELSIAEGPFRFSTDIPLIMQNTAWVSYGGMGVFANGGMHDTGAEKRGDGGMMDMSFRDGFGIGDPVFRADLEVVEERYILPSIGLVSQAKVPIFDVNHSFGTGEWDYGGGITLSRSTPDRFVFMELIYWRLGDTPEVDLMNPVAYSVALGQPLAGRGYEVVFSLSGYSAIIRGVDPEILLGIGLAHSTGSARHFGLSAAVGLTESSPEFTLSLDWLVGRGDGT